MYTVFEQFWTSVNNRTTAITWLIISAAATAAGPFGTFETLEFLPRLLFWAGATSLGIATAMAIRAIVRAVRPDLQEWTETLVLSILFAAAFAPVLFWVLTRVGGTMPKGVLSWLEISSFLSILPVGATAFRRILSDPKLEIAKPEAPRIPRIFQRIPDSSGQKILRISVRDHYVEVFTDRQSETLLMRFSDAISEAEGIPGLQVHRSHWVAEDAVSEVEKDKGRMFLKLIDGSRVPVSRGYQAVVESANIQADSAA